MRTLTDVEVLKEVEQIDRESGWPLWPVLPMKNIYQREDDSPFPRVGILPASRPEHEGKRTVYLMSLLDLSVGKLTSQFEGVESETFANTEELVRAGWIGD